ncbi:MAG: hypothetical protein WDM92_06045 [Caulobacteraceae bacterium]
MLGDADGLRAAGLGRGADHRRARRPLHLRAAALRDVHPGRGGDRLRPAVPLEQPGALRRGHLPAALHRHAHPAVGRPVQPAGLPVDGRGAADDRLRPPALARAGAGGGARLFPPVADPRAAQRRPARAVGRGDGQALRRDRRARRLRQAPAKPMPASASARRR